MTFEEEKQKIINDVKDMEVFIRQEFDMGIEDGMDWFKTSNDLKKLQPDKPKCSTCKYLTMGDDWYCGNEDSPIMEFYREYDPENFGCIYHEEINN